MGAFYILSAHFNFRVRKDGQVLSFITDVHAIVLDPTLNFLLDGWQGKGT